MSSKSKAQGLTGSSPYGNASARGRNKMLVLTVIVLLIAAGAWITRYTEAIGASTDLPAKTSADAGAKAVDQNPATATPSASNH